MKALWWALGAVALAQVLKSGPVAPSPSPASGPAPQPPTPGPVPNPAPTKPPAGRVRVIGDSLGVGLTPPLVAALGGDTKGICVQSTTIDDWAAMGALGAPLAGGASLVIVSLGTNDIASHAAAEPKRAKVAALVAALRKLGAAVAWIGPPSLPWEGNGVRAVLAQELGKLNVPLFDSEAIAFERAPDKIHATPLGYATWAAAVVAWLRAKGLR